MANKTLNNVKINMTLKSTNTRAQLSTSSEDLAVQMGKINKWYESLVPTGGETGNILGWNSDGTAKWVTVAPSADKLNVSGAVGGTTQPVYFKADGTPEAISFTIGKSVPANAVFTDEKVKSTLLAQSTAEASYRPTFVTGATTGGVYIIDSYKVNHTPGTTGVVGNTRLVLGNATASGTANNEEGQIKLYSPGTSFHTIKGNTVSSETIHVLPTPGGTILNDQTTTYTQTVASSATGAYEIGKIKINNTTTTIYGKDTNTTYTAGDHLSLSSTTFSLASYCKTITDWNSATTNGWYMGSSVTNAPSSAWWMGRVTAHNAKYCIQEVWQFTASTDGHKVPHKMRMYVNEVWGNWVDVTVGTQVPENAVFTDAKVTQSETTTSDFRPIVLGKHNTTTVSELATTETDQVYTSTKFYAKPSMGVLYVTALQASSTVCANTANSNTAGGIALYGTDPAAYGIMFRGTTNSGKHGYVQSDWATYFTMNEGGTTRGWVFRRQTTGPIASISGAGNAVFNGSVTVGGNSTNTSGCRMEYNSTTQTLDFVFA